MDTRISKNEIDFLMKNLNPKIVELQRNTIIHADDMKYHLSIILNGLVYLCVEHEDCNRSILNFFRAREYFTKNMLIPVENGISYFAVKSKSYVIYFNRYDIISLNSKDKRWINNTVENIFTLSESSLLKTNLMLHNKSLRSKLTYFFKNEVDKQHSNNINVPVPFSDLADFLSVERTAMMKEIRRMKDEGIISGKNRKLTINKL
ncbi:MAG: Crp/Fnr family transcriptional regulator [Ruminococcus sp.]|nr:Crp/Fnr family transcriptional regulator [Ruminococcus sp.]